MVLYIKQKAFSLVHHYNISNRHGETLYYAEGKKRSGVQLYDSYGRDAFYIKRRHRSFADCYEFYRHDHLCAVSFKKFSFSNAKIKFKVLSVIGSFDIESDLFGVNFGISFDGDMVCAVKNHISQFEDIYELYMEKSQNTDFFLAMVISFDLYLKNKGISRS